MRADASAVDHSLNERVLADAMVDVATELRLADPTEFALMIRGDQEANIADLVNSSSELFFKTGSLKYGLAARFDLGWELTPIVRLDMEFRHEAVTVFFRLMIGAREGRRRNHRCAYRQWRADRRGRLLRAPGGSDRRRARQLKELIDAIPALKAALVFSKAGRSPGCRQRRRPRSRARAWSLTA